MEVQLEQWFFFHPSSLTSQLDESFCWNPQLDKNKYFRLDRFLMFHEQSSYLISIKVFISIWLLTTQTCNAHFIIDSNSSDFKIINAVASLELKYLKLPLIKQENDIKHRCPRQEKSSVDIKIFPMIKIP